MMSGSHYSWWWNAASKSFVPQAFEGSTLPFEVLLGCIGAVRIRVGSCSNLNAGIIERWLSGIGAE